ncbi:MAG: hypothetical protein VB021_07670 [Oscillospiraceae bacterium]|nr:hypothetical protein [Oscillospiraceae bacterium]
MKDKKERRLYFALFAALLIVCGYFFLRGDSTFLLDDTEFHLIRLQSLVDSMRHGEWFPKVYTELYDGYGYAIPLFYCNFFLYVPAVLCLLGTPLLISYNIYNLLLIAATLFCSYYAAQKLTGSALGGFFFSMLYTGSAYFAVDLLKRGAIGETQAFMIAPIVLLGIYNSVFGDSRRNPALVFGFLFLALSHLLSLLLFSLFYLAFLVLFIGRLIREPKRILHILGSAAAVLLLGAGYLLPLAEQLLTTRFFSEWHMHVFHPIWETIAPKNLFSTYGSTQATSSCAGYTVLLMLLLRLFFKPLPKTDIHRFRDACIWGGLFSLFAVTAYFPWLRLDPYINIIQFPWRFFLPATLLICMAGAIMLDDIFRNKKKSHSLLAAGAVAVLCCVQSLCISVPEWKYQQSPPAGEGHAGIIEETSSLSLVDENYLHINNSREFWAERPFVPVSNCDTVNATSDRERGTTTVVFSGNTGDDTYLDLPLVYYLGYSAATADGTQLPVRPSGHGVLEVEIGRLAGGTLTVSYTGTPVQHVSGWISLFSAAAALWICLRAYKKRAPRK